MNPTQITHKKTSWLVILSILLIGGMFIADLILPIGIASGAPYIAVILLSLWFPRRLFTLLITVACTGLTIIGFFISVNPDALWPDISNRAIALLVIWFTAILFLHRKRAEEALRASEERFRNLIEGSIQGILIHHNDTALFANQAYAEMFGYVSTADILNLSSLSTLIAPHETQRFRDHMQATMQGEPVESLFVFQGIRNDGSLIWLENRVHAVNWKGQKVIQSTVFDMTERKRAEEALAIRMFQMEALRMLSVEITHELDLKRVLELIIRRTVRLVDSAGAGVVFLWDENTQQLMPQAWHGLGSWIENVRLSLGEGLTGKVALRRQGMLVNDYQHSSDASPYLSRYVKDTAILAEPLMYRDQLLGVITLGNAGTGLLFTQQDRELLLLIGVQAAIAIQNAKLFREVHDQALQLTETNTALRQSEERYRTFLAQSSEGIYRLEFEIPVSVTTSKEEQLANFYLTGFIAECNDVMAKMHGYSCANELIGARLDQLLIRSTGQNEQFLRNFINSGYRIVDAESREVDPQGKTKAFLNNLVGMVDNNCLHRLWGSQRDITERKQLEERLFQSQKMAAIGTLAGGIAHDFNNILAAILGYTELSLYDVDRASPAWQNLQEVLTAGKRARDLVQEILTFSRQCEQERQPLHLQPLIKEVLTMLRASLPGTIEIHQDIHPHVGAVKANPTQLHQVLMNLCANAKHAMRESGGRLDVGLTNIEMDPNAASLHPDLEPGPYVRLTIRDTGEGMTPEVKKRVFEPFFTTKAIGAGTGMGLAVVHGIVANHGGTIHVESNPGQGTTFSVFLPQTDDLPPKTETRQGTLPETGTGRIMFVEDEEVLAHMGQDMLLRLGYTPVVYTDSQQALQDFQAAPNSYDLVITDQTMPQMTGDALARALRQIRPDLPLILCTGYSHVIDANEALSQGINAFLLKPIGLQNLAATIQEVLKVRRN